MSRVIVAVRRSEANPDVLAPGSTDTPCAVCGAMLAIAPDGHAFAGLGEASFACIPCAASSGNQAALLLYRQYYGRDYNPALGHTFEPELVREMVAKRMADQKETFIAPRCSHEARAWTPIITIRVDGRLLARHWVPGMFCDRCTRALSIEDFRMAIAKAMDLIAPPDRPGEVWALAWVQKRDLAGLFRAPEVEQDLRGIDLSQRRRG